MVHPRGGGSSDITFGEKTKEYRSRHNQASPPPALQASKRPRFQGDDETGATNRSQTAGDCPTHRPKSSSPGFWRRLQKNKGCPGSQRKGFLHYAGNFELFPFCGKGSLRNDGDLTCAIPEAKILYENKRKGLSYLSGNGYLSIGVIPRMSPYLTYICGAELTATDAPDNDEAE